ncbi:hypothetical protein ZOSMA_782G00030 [Zostera marina]|uniref:Uncharacterized protein n=1 Tax=Zostera marina TaxID=29655 RepID=A0A0K9NNJ9_ZOSMR|nr:hypothetical protein ZOSMA_782G00030 [Zostera marina]
MLSSFHRRSTAASEIDQRSSLPARRSQEPKSFMALDRKVSSKGAAFSNEGGSSEVDSRIKQLEGEVVKARDSESKMLESLMSQTKQLEETKIELEEAKIEIKSLKDTIRELDNPICRSMEAHSERVSSKDLVEAQQKIGRMKMEVKLAVEAEEKSKKAMDDLAAALHEVAIEANQAKDKLSLAQSRADAVEEKLRLALGEVERLKIEVEESMSACDTKQEGFRECMALFEDEITRGKKETERLIESEKASKEETSKMRDIMKQALNEATVVKEALEIARNENYQLKDSVDERDRALLEMERDYDALKLSETTALEQIEWLKHVAGSSDNKNAPRCSSESSLPDIPKPPSAAKGKHVKQRSWMSIWTTTEVKEDEGEEDEDVFHSPTETSRAEKSRKENWDENSLSRSGSLKHHRNDEKHSTTREKHRRSGSFSSFTSESKKDHFPGDDDDVCSVNSDYIDHDDYGDDENYTGMNHAHKKKPMYRKFTDILKRKKLPK